MKTLLTDLLENNADFKNQVDTQRFSAAPDDVLIRKGDEHCSVFVVIKGGARLVFDKDEDKPTLATLGIREIVEGETFGEYTLFDPAPAVATVIATEPCDVVQIKTASLQRFFENNPKIGLLVTNEICTSLVKRLKSVRGAVQILLKWGMRPPVSQSE